MEKCSSKVRPLPFEKWDNEKFVVRYNVVELPDVDAEGVEQGVKYEYNEVLVPEVTRKAIIDVLVAQVYDFADEIALAFNRDADKEDIEAHEAFVVECKAIADEILGNE
jgi:hypothetical protein